MPEVVEEVVQNVAAGDADRERENRDAKQ